MRNIFTSEFKVETNRLNRDLHNYINYLQDEKIKYQLYLDEMIEFLKLNYNQDVMAYYLENSEELKQIKNINKEIEKSQKIINSMVAIAEIYKQDDVKIKDYEQFKDEIWNDET